MSTHPLKNTIMATIKEGHLEPISKSRIVFLTTSIFVLLFLSVLFTSLSFGALFFVVDNIDWLYFRHIETSIWQFIISTFPFFWVTLAALFALATILLWKKTPRGYKVKGTYVVCGALAISFVSGLGLHFYHVGKVIDMKTKIPRVHTPFSELRHMMWDQRGKGLVSGVVIEKNDGSFTLQSFGTTSTSSITFLPGTLPGEHLVLVDKKVRIVGVQGEDGMFVACVVFPWEREFFKEHRPLPPPIKGTSTRNTDDRCLVVMKEGRAFHDGKERLEMMSR